MSVKFYSQTVSSKVEIDDTVPFTDVLLVPPVLVSPINGWGSYKIPGSTADAKIVTLVWAASAGADFYVVQWCNNSSFRGPTVRARKVRGLSLDLTEGVELSRFGDRSYYWRVFAYKDTGGSSESSEVWRFFFSWGDMAVGKNACSYVDWKEPTLLGDLFPANRATPVHITIKFDLMGATLDTTDGINWSVRQEQTLGHMDPHKEQHFPDDVDVGEPRLEELDALDPDKYSKILWLPGQVKIGACVLVKVYIKHDKGTCVRQIRLKVGKHPAVGAGGLKIRVVNPAKKDEGVEILAGTKLRIGLRNTVDVPAQKIKSGAGYLVASITMASGNPAVSAVDWESEAPKKVDTIAGVKTIKVILGVGKVDVEGVQEALCSPTNNERTPIRLLGT